MAEQRSSGRRAELCSSVLAPIRNPGRQRNRVSAPREPHSSGVKNTAGPTLSAENFLALCCQFEIMCAVKLSFGELLS